MSGRKTSASSIKCGGFLDSERGFAYPEDGRVLRRGSTQPFQTADGSLSSPAFGTNQNRRLGVVGHSGPFLIFDQHHVCMVPPSADDRNKDVSLHRKLVCSFEVKREPQGYEGNRYRRDPGSPSDAD